VNWLGERMLVHVEADGEVWRMTARAWWLWIIPRFHMESTALTKEAALKDGLLAVQLAFPRSGIDATLPRT
jgi:hypothetical protein